MIYYSTGGFSKNNAVETVSMLSSLGITHFELSGGVHFSNVKDALNILKQKDTLHFAVHNYFPPPQTPFVLNLASLDEEVYGLSIAHCKKAITLASELNTKYYSVHAGFLLDPKPHQLGQKFLPEKLANRQESMDRFLKSLSEVSDFASKMNIELMIENNVLSKNNFETFKDNPFLMAELSETKFIMENTPDNIHLLVDVAHLKVSANSLKFDPVTFLLESEKYTLGYHLSDNDGTSDSNFETREDSWFWPHINKNLDYYSLEVYTTKTDKILSQINLAQEKIYSWKN